jgi:lipoprotein-anchoring transpeptidase ErfK/SrfK
LVAAAVVAVLAAVAGWPVLGVPRVAAVSPDREAFVNEGSPNIVLTVKGLSRLDDVRVALGDRDVTAQTSRDGDRISVPTGELDDGEYTVTFTASSSSLLRSEIREEWRFTVDTSTPKLALDGAAGEGRINTSPATFDGTTEPYATVVVTDGAVTAHGTADASGAYSVSVKLPDGPSDVRLTATDRAGNTTTKKLGVYVDAEPPTLKTTTLGKTLKTSGIKVRIKALDQLEPPALTVELDGIAREFEGEPDNAVFSAGNLAQGTHTLVVTAADKGGNVVRRKQPFVVNSSERFGGATLWPGARGQDVRDLQKRLTDMGVYTGSRTGVYDKRTEAAVAAFQSRFGLTADGRVGGATLTALTGRIVVDLGDLRLTLYRNDKPVKSYPVAAGTSKYPTPTGTYAVTSKIMNPTWYPPNSDWAKDAEPIPPGVTNPLGTRWIGTTAPGVGIHGTIAPSSIGTYASHGCIRMYISDVEDLYERVVVGMPVIIQP